jgi:hypothetical protein
MALFFSKSELHQEIGNADTAFQVNIAYCGG